MSAILAALFLAVSAYAADDVVQNGGFEMGFEGWTRWGKNANLITLDTRLAHSGTNSARIRHGHNALYFTRPLSSGQAYELRFAYQLAGSLQRTPAVPRVQSGPAHLAFPPPRTTSQLVQSTN
jgi:hypothetical protein